MLSGVTSNRIVVCQYPGLGRQLREVPAAVPVVESSRVENFDSQDIHRHSSDCNRYTENMIAYARLGFNDQSARCCNKTNASLHRLII